MSNEMVQGIPPSPLPLNYGLGMIEAFHQETQQQVRLIRLSLSTPGGIGVYFFTPEFGQQFMQDFKVVLHQAKTGIVIAQTIEGENGNGPRT